MTIDEAIHHCEEVAQRQDIKEDEEEIFSEMLGDMFGEFKMNCTNCAAEHRQLAEWLRDLKEAKVLMKKMILDIYHKCSCDNSDCDICAKTNCDYDDRFIYRHKDEIFRIIDKE